MQVSCLLICLASVVIARETPLSSRPVHSDDSQVSESQLRYVAVSKSEDDDDRIVATGEEEDLLAEESQQISVVVSEDLDTAAGGRQNFFMKVKNDMYAKILMISLSIVMHLSWLLTIIT